MLADPASDVAPSVVPTTAGAALTPVEGVKADSAFLRGRLAEEIAADGAGISGEAGHLVKFHGMYAGDDRDQRRERTRAGEEPAHIFMVRASIPGGVLTAHQWLALDAASDAFADGTLRLTSRQGVQFHFVAKTDLHALLRGINAALLTTLAACGDVNRNVMCCPLPHHDGRASELQDLAQRINVRFKPRTRAYYELWLDGEKAASVLDAPRPDVALTARAADASVEPLYGSTYLPRKFKIALAWPGDNCVDVYANDVGIVPAHHPVHGHGCTVLVGGGLGTSHSHEGTFARLADPLCWAPADEVGGVVEAVIAAFRDLGDRTDRKRARLKYVLADHGLAAFRAEVEQRLGRSLAAPVALAPWSPHQHHLGAERGPDGTWSYGVWVESGRVRGPLRSALREIAERFAPGMRLTADQNVLLTGLAPADVTAVEAVLRRHDVATVDSVAPLRRLAMACPALPTCSQALSEAERVAPDVWDALGAELDRRSLTDRAPVVRMTGCPNGCARPATAEIGIVGRTKTGYDVQIGGASDGTRLAATVAEGIKLAELPSLVGPWFDRWAAEGAPDEAFGDFAVRVGLTATMVRSARRRAASAAGDAAEAEDAS